MTSLRPFFKSDSQTLNFDPLTLNHALFDFLYSKNTFYSTFFQISIFRMKKNQRVRCKKPFENWLRVSWSKLNVSAFELKKWPDMFYPGKRGTPCNPSEYRIRLTVLPFTRAFQINTS